MELLRQILSLMRFPSFLLANCTAARSACLAYNAHSPAALAIGHEARKATCGKGVWTRPPVWREGKKHSANPISCEARELFSTTQRPGCRQTHRNAGSALEVPTEWMRESEISSATDTVRLVTQDLDLCSLRCDGRLLSHSLRCLGVGVVVALPGSVDLRVEPRIERYAVGGYAADQPGGEGGCGRFSRVVHIT